MAFVAAGFEYSVSYMYFIPQGIFLKDHTLLTHPALELSGLTWNAFLADNSFPAAIGL